MMNPYNLKVGDLVIYDRNIYEDFVPILYDTIHVVTKIKNGIIYTSGYNWNYSDYGYLNELRTLDIKLQAAIRPYKQDVWAGSKLIFNFR